MAQSAPLVHMTIVPLNAFGDASLTLKTPRQLPPYYLKSTPTGGCEVRRSQPLRRQGHGALQPGRYARSEPFSLKSIRGHAQSIEGSIRTDFSRANLADANFEGAELAYVNFEFAKLQRANFSGADLSSADLAGADLTEANLTLLSARCFDRRDARPV